MTAAGTVGWLYFGRIGLAFCLWTVLAVAIRALWRDLPPSPDTARGPSAAGTATITVVTGGASPGLTQGALFMVNDELTFGRSPDCSVRVEDPFVSSVHARISWRPPRYQLEDMGSSNGTFVGPTGDRLAAPHPLSSGDAIRIGTAEFLFHQQ